jgi:hypothetical protein
MRAFCTIITRSHLSFAKTLFQSIRKFDAEAEFFGLVVDGINPSEMTEFVALEPDHLSERNLTYSLMNQYQDNPDALRWSLKSVLLIHLLNTQKFDQVFFVDPDMYFYSDFRFLYEELGDRSFLLSPHWGCMDPRISSLYFQRLMTDGLYNAGFLGATLKGISTLRWWAESCLRACERDKSRGLHDDQAYLNLFPILNPDLGIITHRGCNVAEWNRFEVSRSLDSEGNLVLDQVFPLVFIHFSNLGYMVEHDPLLVPYLEKYEVQLRKNGFEGSLVSSAKGYVERQRLRKLSWSERIVRRVIGRNRFSRIKGWESNQ